MICLLLRNFLTLKIDIKDIKNCIIAKSRSFPISNEIKRINIVDDIRATVVSVSYTHLTLPTNREV